MARLWDDIRQALSNRIEQECVLDSPNYDMCWVKPTHSGFTIIIPSSTFALDYESEVDSLDDAISEMLDFCIDANRWVDNG